VRQKKKSIKNLSKKKWLKFKLKNKKHQLYMSKITLLFIYLPFLFFVYRMLLVTNMKLFISLFIYYYYFFGNYFNCKLSYTCVYSELSKYKMSKMKYIQYIFARKVKTEKKKILNEN